jgi:hypothetical protein
MEPRTLRLIVLIAGWGSVLLVIAGMAACAGILYGGEFPLGAILWCALL